MKKIFFLSILSALTLFGLSGCYKTCESPFAVNYTLKGACIDLTAPIVGTYTGQVLDSIVGSRSSTSPLTIQIAKVDDSHVAVSSTTNSFISYQATVSASSNGYYLTIPSQSSIGLTVVGAGVYFGNAADGVYVTANKQLIIYSLASTQYQGFTGIQQ